MTTTLERPRSEAPAPTPGPGPRRRKRRWPHRLVPVVLVVLGVAVMLYPVGATFYNNYKQAEFARSAVSEVHKQDPVRVSDQIIAARAYNAALKPVLLKDPWGKNPAEAGPAYQSYLNQLSLTSPMARVRISKIKVDQPVFHGTSDQTLGRGVGHLYGTALPVGGPGTHSVLTAHSGMPNGTHFDRLKELVVGDVFYIDVYGETLAYQVDQTKVVLPDNFNDLPAAPGEDYVTLITCTPYAINSHRLLVRAHRIPYNPAVDVRPSPVKSVDWTIQPWMRDRFIFAGVAALVLVVMATGWVRSDLRARKRRKLSNVKGGTT